MAQLLDEILDRINAMPKEKQAELQQIAAQCKQVWVPNPGPQTEAYFSQADELFYGGCVSGDTEYLTPTGWQRIDSYDGGDVAQWHEDGDLEFVKPARYIDEPCEEMIWFRNKTRASMKLTPDHRMVLYDYQGKLVVKSAKAVAKNPSKHKIPVNFKSLCDGLNYTDDELRLAVAIHADGNLTYRKDGGAHCRVSLRKSRKIERFEGFLAKLNIKPHIYKNPKRPTEIHYRFDSPILTKQFEGEWWQASQRQLEIILSEMSYWDGNISGVNGGDICFSTTHKCDADFIQYAAHACDRVATFSIYDDDIPNISRLYKVHISHKDGVKSSVSLRCDNIRISKISESRKYCFEVPTSYFLARHNGRIFITGNSAGGGKTSLIIGLSLTEHKRSLILRRTNREASKLVDDFVSILGSRDGYNGQENVWRLPDDRVIDIGGCQHEDDKQKFKGVARDFCAFDEIADFTQAQYKFITAWNRSTESGQRCRVVCAGNPPTTVDGLWVVQHWAAWLDPAHPNPAKPGELRWYVKDKQGKDIEVKGAGEHEVDGEMMPARSRSFIRARLSDNPELASTNYDATLASLPPELRRAYRDGEFDVSLRDDDFQVIPTAWIKAAQERWTPLPPRGVPMCSLGVDVARGGADFTTIVARHDGWFAPIVSVPGSETPLGSDVAALIIKHKLNDCDIVIDMGGGYGGAPMEHLIANGFDVKCYNGAESTTARTQDRKLGFVRKRSQVYWQFREALDPDQPGGSPIMLPPDDNELVADLAAPRFQVDARGIVLESKKDLVKRISRSPDKGDAVVMCWQYGGRQLTHGNMWRENVRNLVQHSGTNIKVVQGYENRKRRR